MIEITFFWIDDIDNDDDDNSNDDTEWATCHSDACDIRGFFANKCSCEGFFSIATNMNLKICSRNKKNQRSSSMHYTKFKIP